MLMCIKGRKGGIKLFPVGICGQRMISKTESHFQVEENSGAI